MHDGPGGAEAAALELRDVVRTYSQAGVPLPVLRDVSFSLRRGEIVALVGPSGAGKSTLLHVAGLLEKPDGGTVWLDGRECGALSDQARTSLRGAALGFVYQFHHLLPEFSALENVAMPLLVRRMDVASARARARALLERVGLGERLEHRPYQLSGGERQRAAVARALVTEPKLVLADEPTGNLDGTNAESVFTLMLELNRERRTSLVVVTHDLRLAARMERRLEIEQGVLSERPPSGELRTSDPGGGPVQAVEASRRDR
jgi:lipoprotein-releasing system ATP-binding protein